MQKKAKKGDFFVIFNLFIKNMRKIGKWNNGIACITFQFVGATKRRYLCIQSLNKKLILLGYGIQKRNLDI